MATNLPEDQLGYDVEFRDGLNYIPYPNHLAGLAVANGVTNSFNSPYYPSIGAPSLVTLIVSNSTWPGGAGWRIQGEPGWRGSGAAASNILADNYTIEYEPVSGKIAPHGVTVPIFNPVVTVTADPYTNALPLTNALPVPIAALTTIVSSVTNYPRLPYAFNGQLWTRSNGFASGVVVRPTVVLTVQHAIFDDRTLSYTAPVYWFFQKQQGEYDARPLPAHGSYRLGGYSYLLQRSNDVMNPSYGTNVSSPQSREFDVAALYFSGPAGRGGFGGYLSSDAPANEWLTSTNPKMLVGYPVDSSAYGYTGVEPGKMHATAASNFNFTLQNGGHVYASTNFLGLPGNSGGPLYVLHSNNIFYPAAVFLGTVGNTWVVRTIDSNVVYTVNQAATL